MRGRLDARSCSAAVPVLAARRSRGLVLVAGARGDGTPVAVGMVRTTEIRIAPEISGRLAHFLVEPGQAVQRGQPVAVLSNPELWAAVGAARAQVDKARSDRDRVYAGVRDEQVQALQREIEKARAVHTQAAAGTGAEIRSGGAIGCFGAGAGYRHGRRRRATAPTSLWPRRAMRRRSAVRLRRNARWRMRRWSRRRRHATSSRRGRQRCCCAPRRWHGRHSGGRGRRGSRAG